jgi:hypothetical protein
MNNNFYKKQQARCFFNEKQKCNTTSLELGDQNTERKTRNTK